MTRVEIVDGKSSLDRVARTAAKETVVLTRRGKPVAAVLSVDEFDLENLSLSENPKFIAILERSRRRHAIEGGISTDEMRRRFGLPPRKASRRGSKSRK